jgi:hypothetical protein
LLQLSDQINFFLRTLIKSVKLLWNTIMTESGMVPEILAKKVNLSNLGGILTL